MKTKIPVVAVGVSLLVSVIGWVSTSSATIRASSGKATQVDSKQTSLKMAGNTLTLTDDYFQSGKQVGSDQIVCALTGPGPLALCTAANQLPNGEIISVGRVTVPPITNQKTTVAIVGGTGAYTTAKGTIDITPTSPTESTNTFHIG